MSASQILKRLKELGYIINLQRSTTNKAPFILSSGNKQNRLYINGYRNLKEYDLYVPRKATETYNKLRPAIHALYCEVVRERLGL